MPNSSELVVLSNVSGISRKYGQDQHGCQWSQFELDPFCGECECEGQECDQETCPRFVTECSICGELVSSGWLCLDGGEEACCDCVEFTKDEETAEATGPQEDDYTTTDHILWYQSGKLVLATTDPNNLHTSADDTYAQVKAHMDKAKYWPNAWFISDHGNAHLIRLY